MVSPTTAPDVTLEAHLCYQTVEFLPFRLVSVEPSRACHSVSLAIAEYWQELGRDVFQKFTRSHVEHRFSHACGEPVAGCIQTCAGHLKLRDRAASRERADPIKLWLCRDLVRFGRPPIPAVPTHNISHLILPGGVKCMTDRLPRRPRNTLHLSISCKHNCVARPPLDSSAVTPHLRSGSGER